MGFEIAKKAVEMGAEVTLVSGPGKENSDGYNIKRVDVVSALEMKDAMETHFSNADIVIMSAAVADYRPKETANQKIKKNDENLTLELIKNPDILKALGEKKQHQILIGFALETHDELNFAKEKLAKKNLDFIVLNSMNDEKAGFQKDTNKITIIPKNGNPVSYEAKNKNEVAKDILNFILENFEI
jgi:phosphopantothenoylcysteine decarboxylase/phosphopantothenate--cysteine ligase